MKIEKPNDIFVASLSNPNATTYDLMSADLDPENTSLYSKDEYKSSKYVEDHFKGENGEFDDLAFDDFYNKAASHYAEMTNESYLEGLDTVVYSPFDVTRPKEAELFKVNVEFSEEFNPFKQLYSRTGINSTDESPYSLRELAQRGNIFDSEKNEWLDETANDRGLLNNLFGDTLIYAQWDDDGVHTDQQTGNQVKHKKGDWKFSEDGDLFVETLGDREIYGKQVLNPMDVLTTDGSFANKLDLFEGDNKESSAVKTTFKLAAEIAPLLIPGFNTYYAGVKAAIGLSSVMPTFFKSFESLLLGDNKSAFTENLTAAEGYMAKFNQRSTTDEGQESMASYESIAQMTSDIFSQIFEQRAAASLSKILTKSRSAAVNAKQLKMSKEINDQIYKGLKTGSIGFDEVKDVQKLALSKIPELKSLQKMQSGLSKSLSLGYMAMTSTGDVYGEAIESGYDRRTAGFTALASAAGQYGLMMNNRMGDWFLDNTTGYTAGVNKALVRKATRKHLKDVSKGFKDYAKSPEAGRAKLSMAYRGIKNSFDDLFNNSSVVGEALLKNSIIEGVEEVTEEMVQDATKGIVDVMSYLGLTKQKGSFNTIESVFSAQGAEKYLASLLGGVLGGAMFEFHRTKMEPFLTGVPLNQDTKNSIYDLVGQGHTQLLIDEINKNRSKLGNNYISPIHVEGEPPAPAESGKSEADAIADAAISIVQNVDGIMNAEGLVTSDEDIIAKAIKDHLVIRDLEKTRGENDFGVEALIVDDFRTTAKELTEINSKLKRALTEEKESPQTTELQALANEKKKKLEEILAGERAEQYFTNALFYLAKQVSENWITIDRNTYSRAKYNKNFHELPETGTGTTKETVEKEWKQYLEGKDVKTDLEMSTNAYLELEQTMNKSIDSYVTTGYAEERKKTIDKILDLQRTIANFDTSNEETKQLAIDNFINVAKQLSEETGKKIIPWDTIKTDFQKQINDNNLIVLEKEEGKTAPVNTLYGETIETEQGEISKETVVQGILTDVINAFPQEAMHVGVIADHFNARISHENKKVADEITRTTEEPGWEQDPEAVAKVAMLEQQKLPVKLLSYGDTPKHKKNVLAEEQRLKEIQDNLGLNDQNIQLGHILNLKEHKTVEDVDTIIANYIKEKKKQGIKLNSLTYEQTQEAYATSTLFSVLAHLHGKDYPGVKGILEGTIPLSQMARIMRDFHTYVESVKKDAATYMKEVSKSTALLEERPEIFKIKNYALEALVKEVKAGNLDKEVIIEIERMFTGIADDLASTYFGGMGYNGANALKIVFSYDEIMPLLEAEESDYYSMGFYETPKGALEFLNLDNIAKLQELKVKMEAFKENFDPKQLKNITELSELVENKDKYLSNTIYDFLQEFEVSLGNTKRFRSKSIFEILKDEELSLFRASDVTSYLSEGVRSADIKEGLNTLKLMKSVVHAMQTTEIGVDDIYGFIASRQNFVAKNNLESDVAKLKTVSSDMATLMLKDLERIETKLGFLQELAKNNSSKLNNESELIRTNMSKVFVESWKELTTKKIMFKGKPVVPDLDDIMSGDASNEKKLLEIESKFFEHHKELTLPEQKELLSKIKNKFDYSAHLEDLSVIDKEAKKVNNLDFVMNIAANLSVHSKDFSNKLLTMLKEDFDKAPFYTQELSVKIAYASIVNPELFADLITNSQKKHTHLTEHITYILGGAGTGKTSVIFKSLILLLKGQNPNLSVWFTAPHSDQSKALEEAVMSGIETKDFSIAEFNKQALFEKLGIKELIDNINTQATNIVDVKESEYLKYNGESIVINHSKIHFGDITQDVPHLLFIDEVTHFNALELDVLNEYVKHLQENGKQLKIIGSGDIAQKGAFISNASYSVDRVSGILAPQLTLTVRAGNTQKRSNNDALVGLVNSAIKIYEDNNDTPKVKQLIKGNLTFRAFKGGDTVNGDYIVKDDSFNKTTLKPIIAALKKPVEKGEKKKTIGVLVGGDFRTDIEGYLEEAEVPKDQIRFYTPDNIQGAENDYVIFNTKLIQGSAITHKLKELYTYMSRAKAGTIIIKDAEIEDLPISNLMEDVTEYVEPLSQENIEEVKNERIKKLTEMLDPNFSLLNPDFKFGIKADLISPDDEIIDHIFVGGETIQQSTDDEEKDKEEKHTVPKTPEDNFNYMFHSFYNDLNVKVVRNKKDDNVVLLKSDNINSGLNFLFKDDSDSITMTSEEFSKTVDLLINLKYKVLNNISNGKKGLVPTGDTTLENIFNGTYVPKRVNAEIVYSKTTYSEDFNAPYGKIDGKEEKHLTTGDPHLNMYVKLTHKGVEYYIHIASAPSLDTVKLKFGVDSNTYTKYKEFVKNPEITEVSIDPTNIEVITSTRLVKQSKEELQKKNSKIKLDEYTLNDLNKIPGLRFYDMEKNKISNINSYNLFPTKFPEFKAVYDKITFGKPIPEVKLLDMFSKYKGKPYVAVTFMNEIGNQKSQVKILLLKSKTRKFSTIKPDPFLIKEGYNDKFFSGSQVLDLLISLATKKPELYEELLSQGFLKDKDGKVMDNLAKYFTGIDKDLKKDIISHMTYEKVGDESSVLRKVIELIRKEVKEGNTDSKDIREKALAEIKGDKQRYKFWFSKFWSVLTLQGKLEKAVNSDNIDGDLRENYTRLADILSKVMDFWGDEEIYHNVKIQSVKGATDDQTPYKIDRKDADRDNLYVTLIPEGPRLLIQSEDIVKSIVVEKEEEVKEKEEEKKEKQEKEEEPKTPPTDMNLYFETLTEENNSYIKGKLDSVIAFLNDKDVDDIGKVTKDAIKKNWNNLYKLLESEIEINGQTVLFKELDEDELDANWEAINFAIEYDDYNGSEGMSDFHIETIFSQLLGHTDTEVEIWPCE